MLRRIVRLLPGCALFCLFVSALHCGAQTFGMAGMQKKVILDRKLPASGHIDGATFEVVIETTGSIGSYSTDPKITEQSLSAPVAPANTSSSGAPSSRSKTRGQAAAAKAPTPAAPAYASAPLASAAAIKLSTATSLASDLKNSIEALILHNDSSLSVDTIHPDTIILCRILTYDQPLPRATLQQTGSNVIASAASGKSGAADATKSVPLQRYTGLLTVNFKASSTKTYRSVGADSVTAKYDEEFSPSGAEKGVLHSASNSWHHFTKGGSADDTPPTPAELRDLLMKDAATQVVSHFVTTRESIPVLVAHGKSLDAAANMEMAKLWPRAIDHLEKSEPFKKPEDDAYRDYDLGLAYEALAYDSKDLTEALGDLEKASKFYGKAIDAKPLEKNFMFPEKRVETSIAYYKKLQATPTAAQATAAPVTSAGRTAPAEALTDDQIIALVAAGLDTENIIDTIKNAPAVKFDLSTQGLLTLTKAGVKGNVIAAMKVRARAAG